MPRRSPSPRFPRSRPAAVALLTFLVALSARQEPAAEWPAAAADDTVTIESGAPMLDRAGAFVRLAAGEVDGELATDTIDEVAPAIAEPGMLDEADLVEATGYPHAVEFLTVVVAGTPMPLAFMDVSPVGPVNGRTVLLLHGRDLAGDSWTPTIAALSAAGYRVLVPDQVGHGQSGHPVAEVPTTTLAAHARVLLDSLGAPRVAVVGHGLGADVAVRLAAAGDGLVDRIVLLGVDPTSLGPDHAAADLRARVRQPVLLVADGADHAGPIPAFPSAAFVTIPGLGATPHVAAMEPVLLGFLGM